MTWVPNLRHGTAQRIGIKNGRTKIVCGDSGEAELPHYNNLSAGVDAAPASAMATGQTFLFQKKENASEMGVHVQYSPHAPAVSARALEHSFLCRYESDVEQQVPTYNVKLNGKLVSGFCDF